MIQCGDMSDRMPEVALGRSAWSAEEQAHLDACSDCGAEWRLVQSTSNLGATIAPLRGPEVMTATVLGRIAGERSAARSRRLTWLAAGLAAAAAIAIAVRIPRAPAGRPATAQPPSPVATGPRKPTPSAPTPLVASGEPAVSLPELQDLPEGELQAILGSLDEPTSVSPALDGTGFDNMDDHELEDVLAAWEG
jgi:hypothetical protein